MSVVEFFASKIQTGFNILSSFRKKKKDDSLTGLEMDDDLQQEFEFSFEDDWAEEFMETQQGQF